MTIHALRIRRGGQVIDILAEGQTFSVLRREPNLESAMLDGVLTANLQPEGIQVGDILELELSQRSSDPLFAGKPEHSIIMLNAPITSATASIEWPSSLNLDTRISPDLPAAKIEQRADTRVLRLARSNVTASDAPAGAPLRFSLPPSIDVTAFRSWSEIGALMSPLYVKAARIPEVGPLRSEVDKIKAASSDPTARTLAALALVQNRVRYVALLMGQGGYVPADAETTWNRRFGDCKAKTALLLGLLEELGVSAVPVAVNTIAGDAIEGRLPMIGLFNHVLVRAEVGGEELWLDGTRTGDTSVGQLQTPNYRWGLELLPTGRLIPMLAPVPATPLEEYSIDLDASAGLTLPAKARISAVFRGPAAAEINQLLKQVNSAQRDEVLRAYWKRHYAFVSPSSVSSTLDSRTGELRLETEGTAEMDWSDGYYETDVSLGREMTLDRKPGPYRDAPVANAFPHYSITRQTIRLPAEFVKAAPPQKYPSVAVTLGGTEYRRSATITGTVFSVEASERTLVPEISLAEALKVKDQLKSLSSERIQLRVPAGYRPSKAELEQLGKLTLTDENALIDRGVEMLDAGRLDDALRDFDAVVAKNPRNAWAFANRGMTKVWMEKFTEADKDLAEAEKLDPDNPVAARARGLLAYKEKDFAKAIDFFSRSLVRDMHNTFTLGYRALSYAAAGDRNRAFTEAEQVLRVNPAWVDLRLLRVNKLRRDKDKEGAIKEAMALAKLTDSSYAQVSAARALNALGKRTEAEQAYNRAIALEPRSAYIYLNRAYDRPREDKVGRRADADTALTLAPEDPDAIAFRAELYEDEGKYAEALKLYDRALAITSDLPGLHLGRAVALHKLGRAADGDKAFAAALPPKPTATDYNNVCWAKATAGLTLESALSDCNAALKMEPDAAAYLDSRALVHLRLGRIDEAIADYSKAISGGAGASSLMGRSIAWLRKGEKEKAAADRQAALQESSTIEAAYEGYGVGPTR